MAISNLSTHANYQGKGNTVNTGSIENRRETRLILRRHDPGPATGHVALAPVKKLLAAGK
jgi:hypothetical protein